MISIVREQVVYNAGSHLDVKCVYRNRTANNGGGSDGYGREGGKPSDREMLRLLEASRNPQFYLGDEASVPEDTIVWTHDGERFSHRNRRR